MRAQDVDAVCVCMCKVCFLFFSIVGRSLEGWLAGINDCNYIHSVEWACVTAAHRCGQSEHFFCAMHVVPGVWCPWGAHASARGEQSKQNGAA